MNQSNQDSGVKKLLSLGAVAVVIVAFGVYLGVSGAFTPSVSAATLEIGAASHNFGEIDIDGGKVSTTFPIRNAGAEPVDILWGKTTCMCTEGTIGGKTFGMHEGFLGTITIGPGETQNLTAVFDPMAHGPSGIGPITRKLILGTNSTSSEEIEFKFEGNVIKKS